MAATRYITQIIDSTNNGDTISIFKAIQLLNENIKLELWRPPVDTISWEKNS